MALTITQEPQQLNAAYGNLVYTVSASDSSLFQYQYVMDVISGSERLARVRQYPNPNGVAVFDPSQIMTDYIEYFDFDFSDVEDYGDLTTGSTLAQQQMIQFTVRFGEEYGTSPSSSVTLYDGSGNEGNTGLTGSNTPLHIFPGQTDSNDYFQFETSAGFNFFTGSRTLPTGDTATYDYNRYFTRQPNFGALGGNLDDRMRVSYKDNGCVQAIISASEATDLRLTPTLIGPGTTLTSVDLSGPWPRMVTIPIGPKQCGASESQWDNADGLSIEIDSVGNSEIPNRYIRIYKDEEDCHYDRVGIQFVNRLGAWDYYGFTLPVNETVDVERDTYEKPFVDYGTSIGSSVVAQFAGRQGGTTSYSTSVMKRLNVTTPYLGPKMAYHVEQIFDSPVIRLLYSPGQDSPNATQPKPVILTNNSYVRNTNKRGQKLFQFTFDFEFSNNPKGR